MNPEPEWPAQLTSKSVGLTTIVYLTMQGVIIYHNTSFMQADERTKASLSYEQGKRFVSYNLIKGVFFWRNLDKKVWVIEKWKGMNVVWVKIGGKFVLKKFGDFLCQKHTQKEQGNAWAKIPSITASDPKY